MADISVVQVPDWCTESLLTCLCLWSNWTQMVRFFSFLQSDALMLFIQRALATMGSLAMMGGKFTILGDALFG